MDIDRADVILYIYLVGVLISGVFIERMAARYGQAALVSGALIAAGVWLWYYKWSITPRLEYVQQHEKG